MTTSRFAFGLARQAYDRAMHGKRTWHWWAARIELGIGIGAVVFELWVGSVLTQPMFGGHSVRLGPIVAEHAVVLAALTLAFVGLLWMIRLFPGPPVESPSWRFQAGMSAPGRRRPHGRRPPDAPTPRPERAPGWWPTRILLGIAIASVLAIGLGLIASVALSPGLRWPEIAAFVASSIGLAWMIRIFRGPPAEAPPWRYRGR